MADLDHQLSLGDQGIAMQSGAWRDYVQLAKPRLNAMALATTLIGYLLAAGGLGDGWRVAWTMLGAALAATGSSALNQYLERDVDRLMPRTANRPLPAGRMAKNEALCFGAVCIITGVLLLAWCVNLLAGFLCVLTVAAYLFAYTPLKCKGPVATLVGAIPGALPPMIGWAAARGELSIGAWVLFSIMFMWQLPHFFSIAWIYRDEYRRAGMPMISVTDHDGLRTALQIVMCSLSLLFVSLLPIVVGLAGPRYFLAALLLGVGFLILGVRFAWQRSPTRARQVLYGSLMYLPGVLSLWLLDRMLS